MTQGAIHPPPWLAVCPSPPLLTAGGELEFQLELEFGIAPELE